MIMGLYALDAETGNLSWRFWAGSTIFSTPAVANGLVYFGSDDYKVYAVYQNNGTECWNFSPSNHYFQSSPAVADGVVYIGSYNTRLYALNAFTGKEHWNYPLGGLSILSSPAVSNGVVYIGSMDKKLYAFGTSGPSPIIVGIIPSSALNTAPVNISNLAGSGFGSGAIVNLTRPGQPNITATNVSVLSSNQIVCSFPIRDAAPGNWTVWVTNIDGKCGYLMDGFTVTQPAPVISGISPSLAPNTGQISTVITGTYFRTGASVRLTNSSINIPGTVSFLNSTTIHCSFPLTGAPLWIYNITVRNPDGTTGTKPNAFTVTNSTPAISSITPSSGFNSGNLPVTIIGSAFRNGAIVSLFNNTTSIQGLITNRTTTRILATFPLNGTQARLYNLSVLNIDGSSVTKTDAFTVKPSGDYPVIGDFTPRTGVNNASLPFTINGSGFRTGATITITNGSVTKTVIATSVTTGQIKCSLPLTGLPIGLYNCTVKNPNGTAVTEENGLSVKNPVPTITTTSPPTGFNTSIVPIAISGANFVAGLETVLVSESTSIHGTVSGFTAKKFTGVFNMTGSPSGLYNLTVTNPGGPNTTKKYCFNLSAPNSLPNITGFSPVTGVNNGSLLFTVNGTGFRAGVTISITNDSTIMTVTASPVTTSQIKCKLPLTGLPIGLYNLTVRNSDGSSDTRKDEFTVKNPTPSVSTVSPASGFNTSSLAIAITGTRFVSGLEAVLVNESTTIPGSISGFSATKFTGTFNLTGSPSGFYNLTVTNPGGQYVTKIRCFNLSAPVNRPDISGFSPLAGENTGALPFVVNGSNFRPQATVTITNDSTSKTVPATSLTPGQIRCTLPLTGLPIGLYNLTVRNSDGSSDIRQDEFTVKNPLPTITTVTPAAGYNTGLLPITISGAKFVTGLQAALVNGSINITGTVSGLTATKFTGTFNLTGVPAQLYNLTVTNPGGSSVTWKNFINISSPATSPVIDNFNPQSGVNTAALPFVVNGSNFRTGATVMITNGTTTKTVTPTTVTSAKITCSLPLTGLPIGLYDLMVRNMDGSNVTRLNAFTVKNPDPVITTLTPVSGYNTGTIPVTITGTKFVSGAAIFLTNRSTTIPGMVVSLSGTSISGMFPLSGAPEGIYNLTVSNPGERNGTKLNAFTVRIPGTAPVISTINPASGFNNANLPVTIIGLNFNKPTVYLNQGSLLKLAAPTAGKVSTATTVYVTLPLNGVPGGLYNITVRNNDGVNVTAQDIFYVTDQAWMSKPSKTISRSIVKRAGEPKVEGQVPSVVITKTLSRSVI